MVVVLAFLVVAVVVLCSSLIVVCPCLPHRPPCCSPGCFCQPSCLFCYCTRLLLTLVSSLSSSHLMSFSSIFDWCLWAFAEDNFTVLSWYMILYVLNEGLGERRGQQRYPTCRGGALLNRLFFMMSLAATEEAAACIDRGCHKNDEDCGHERQGKRPTGEQR